MNSALIFIEMRRKSVAKDLAEAIARREWSKVAGLDGIEIGLIIAKKILEEEIKHGKYS